MIYFRMNRNNEIKQTLIILPESRILHYFAGETDRFNCNYTNATRVKDNNEMRDIIQEYRCNGYIFRNYAESYRDRKRASWKNKKG